MNVVRRTFRLLFNRRFVLALSWVLLITTIAAAINVVGIHVIGNVNDWSQWLKDHSVYFLAWRLCLYGATACGWWRMRKRILSRELAAETAIRLSRTEIAAVLTVLALEVAVLMQSR